MTLTWPVALAVLFGALLHASWNALVKSGTDKELDTALLNLAGGLLSLPLLLLAGLPAPSSWPWLLTSVAIHVAYFALLAAAYRHGELSLAYPLMRGTAPVIVAALSLAVFGEALTPLGWTGVLAVSVGVVLLGRAGRPAGRGVLFALANAVMIAGYTLVDARGARASGNAVGYAAALCLLNALPYSTSVMARRGWRSLAERARQRGHLALVGAAASIGSYAIALWAMTRAPVATVAALRETSVLFAALIATWHLNERFTAARALATAAIVAGVAALRLA